MASELAITGELVFSTVPHLRRVGRRYILRSEQPTIEFNHITRCDSSGVALLLAWLRDAKEKGKVIRFAHIPQQLLDVAEVYGTLGVLQSGIENA